MSKRICSVDGCERTHYGKGFCNPHWARWRKYGDPLGSRPKGPAPQPRVERAEKTCTLCGLAKAAHFFVKRATAPDGLSSWCKACVAEKARAHYRSNRESAIARAAQWAQENPERARSNWVRAYWERRDHYREQARAWRLDNPDKVSIHEARRRSRLEPVGPIDLDALWTGVCVLCGSVLDPAIPWPDPWSKSVDHITPLSKGGLHTQSNLQWAHLVCNMRKGDRLV